MLRRVVGVIVTDVSQGQEVQGPLSSIKGGKFLDKLNNFSFSRTLFHGIVQIKMKNGE
jgi:hypothetical protein